MIAPLRTIEGGRDGMARSGHLPLGELLKARELLEDPALEAALARQRGTRQPLGEVLIAHGAVSAEAVARALAEQGGFGYADLDRDPPDRSLILPDEIDAYLRHGILPWGRLGGVVVYAITDPANAPAALAALPSAKPFAFFAVTEPARLHRALTVVAGPEMAARAADRVPEDLSARGLGTMRRLVFGSVLLLLAALVLETEAALLSLAAFVFLVNTANMALRIAVLLAGIGRHHAEPEALVESGAIRLADKHALPRISLLVPLFREAAVVDGLIGALRRLDYPCELLDVKLLLEAGDGPTHDAIAARVLPPWMETIIVPPGHPQTKPRAMNHALDFCTGEFVGILDAEDRPEPDQLLRIARHLRAAPQEVACVQCQLSYWNAAENWLTRCFQIEYAIWFDVLLGGFRRLGLPIPLGGTSVYFRRSALQRLGGWDAWNVTEDADLGMRLARQGMRCEVVRSTTLEEANCRLGSWIRQRSRWLKGYFITWMCHMRAPVRFWREIGPRGFFGFNAIFLGAATAYLAMPVFWFTSLEWLLTGSSIWDGIAPEWVAWPVGASLLAGQAVMLATASLALRRRRALGLLPWVASLPFYWTLGAVAAWKAVAELFVAPFYWDKTRHGISRYFGKPKG